MNANNGTGDNKNQTNRLTTETPTYDVNKQNAIKYPSLDTEGVILPHTYGKNTGHYMMLALAKKGFDFSKYFTAKGVPTEEFMQILDGTANKMVTDPEFLKKKHTLKTAVINNSGRVPNGPKKPSRP